MPQKVINVNQGLVFFQICFQRPKKKIFFNEKKKKNFDNNIFVVFQLFYRVTRLPYVHNELFCHFLYTNESHIVFCCKCEIHSVFITYFSIHILFNFRPSTFDTFFVQMSFVVYENFYYINYITCIVSTIEKYLF